MDVMFVSFLVSCPFSSAKRDASAFSNRFSAAKSLFCEHEEGGRGYIAFISNRAVSNSATSNPLNTTVVL